MHRVNGRAVEARKRGKRAVPMRELVVQCGRAGKAVASRLGRVHTHAVLRRSGIGRQRAPQRGYRGAHRHGVE